MTNQPKITAEGRGPVRRRLGRGLNALMGSRADAKQPTPPEADDTGEMRFILLESIEPNPFQPRRDLGEKSLADLAASIQQHGLLQPVLVRPHGGHFQLIAGERRWRAAQTAGLKKIPCRIIQRDDSGSSEAALEENLKRKDLNPLEKAMAFRDYRKRFGCSIEFLARKLSMQRSTISNFLRLLELPESVQEALLAERISNGHARTLLSLTEADLQAELCRRIQRESLSVRETEDEVRKLLIPQETIPFTKPNQRPAPPALTSHLRSLAEQLTQQMGAKVEIRPSAKDRGRIVVHFQSNDDFERIVRRFRNAG